MRRSIPPFVQNQCEPQVPPLCGDGEWLKAVPGVKRGVQAGGLGEKLVRTEYGSGDVLTMTLMEKLILLSAVKFATLDAYGMGIEMEGGKPGWYDALNGMPGLFGSSMAETYELARMLSYTIDALKQYPGEVALIEELGCFLDELNLITRLEHDNIMRDEELLSFWNRINDAKEIYRDKTYQGVSGKKMVYHTEQLAAILEGFLEIVTCGIKRRAGSPGRSARRILLMRCRSMKS